MRAINLQGLPVASVPTPDVSFDIIVQDPDAFRNLVRERIGPAIAEAVKRQRPPSPYAPPQTYADNWSWPTDGSTASAYDQYLRKTKGRDGW